MDSQRTYVLFKNTDSGAENMFPAVRSAIVNEQMKGKLGGLQYQVFTRAAVQRAVEAHGAAARIVLIGLLNATDPLQPLFRLGGGPLNVLNIDQIRGLIGQEAQAHVFVDKGFKSDQDVSRDVPWKPKNLTFSSRGSYSHQLGDLLSRSDWRS